MTIEKEKNDYANLMVRLESTFLVGPCFILNMRLQNVGDQEEWNFNRFITFEVWTTSSSDPDKNLS